ncbi:MAG: glutaredoxin family protein [Candidatus Limnocylindria bacterium]
MPEPSVRPTLYVRDGCHLCEEASALLGAMLGPNGYDSVDIRTDDDLLVRYAHRIPVLAIDGEDRLELIITRPDLEAMLDAER